MHNAFGKFTFFVTKNKGHYAVATNMQKSLRKKLKYLRLNADYNSFFQRSAAPIIPASLPSLAI